MNKFYKTSYPKTSSINQIFKNKKQIKRQSFKKQDILNSHLENYKEILTQDIKQKNRFHLDNKIQIDSDLLFNKNEHFKKNKNIEKAIDMKIHGGFSLQKGDQRKTLLQNIEKRKQQNKTESGFYEPLQENEEPTKIKLRPQSKQQTRTRILSGHASRRNQFQRPQTSKGSRKSAINERLISLEDQKEIDIIISKNRSRTKKEATLPVQEKASSDVRGKKKYNFQTSIDDEFLSLFAN